MPELIGSLDAEEPRPPAAPGRAAALDEPALAHHAQHPLAVDRAPEPASGPGTDHPVAVGRVGLGLGDDRRLDLVRRRTCRRGRRPSGLGDAVDRLAADLRYA